MIKVNKFFALQQRRDKERGRKNYSFFPIITIIILTISATAIYFFQDRKLKERISVLDSSFEKIAFLPTFSVKDIFGNTIKSDDLRGKFVYIQFVNPALTNHLELLKSVYVEYNNYEDLIILAFTKDLKKFKKNFFLFNDIFVVRNDYEKLKSTFHVPPCCESFFIFNHTGKLVETNMNIFEYDEAVKPYLMNLIENKKFSISYLIKQGENIANIDWFEQIKYLIENENANYYLISMFTKICSNCRSGWIINKLKELYKLNDGSFFLFIILSDKFNETDAENLKNQLGINFSVVIAKEKLSSKWKLLIKEFRESDLTNIVFLIDKEGRIVRTMGPGCNCTQEFFSFLYNRIKA